MASRPLMVCSLLTTSNSQPAWARIPKQPTVAIARQSTNHYFPLCSAFKWFYSTPIWNYDELDKFKYLYQLKAFGFYGLEIVYY